MAFFTGGQHPRCAEACSNVFSPVLILSPVLPERVARRENGLCLLSLRQNKNSSFPGHVPGKDTLRAANAATKEGFTGRKRVKRKRLPVVFPSYAKDIVFSRTCAGKRHLKSRERGDERGGQRGRKRTNEPREVRVFAPPSKSRERGDESGG